MKNLVRVISDNSLDTIKNGILDKGGGDQRHPPFVDYLPWSISMRTLNPVGCSTNLKRVALISSVFGLYKTYPSTVVVLLGVLLLWTLFVSIHRLDSLQITERFLHT